MACKQLLTAKNDAIVNSVDVNFGFHYPSVRLQTAVEGTNWVFGFATRVVRKPNRALNLQIQICKSAMVKHRDFTILRLNSKWRRFFWGDWARNRAEKSQRIKRRRKTGYPPPYQLFKPKILFFARWFRKMWFFEKNRLFYPMRQIIAQKSAR